MFFAFIILVSQLAQSQSVIDSPKFCFKQNSYPCAIEFNQKLKLKHKSFHLEAVPKTQVYFKNELEWKLIAGQVLVETQEKGHWIFFGNQKIEVQGEFIIKEQDQNQMHFYQLRGLSKFNQQDLYPGFQIKIKKGQWQNPEPITADSIIGLYSPFKVIAIKDINQLKLGWGNTAEHASQAYRILASELDQARENSRLDQIRQRQDKEAEDLKYKEAFRLRYFNPEKWSEFIEHTDLSP